MSNFIHLTEALKKDNESDGIFIVDFDRVIFFGSVNPDLIKKKSEYKDGKMPQTRIIIAPNIDAYVLESIDEINENLIISNLHL